MRRPASTCATGMRRWNAASAAAKAELVSPWTMDRDRIGAGDDQLARGLLTLQVGEPPDDEVLDPAHERRHALVEAGSSASDPEVGVHGDPGKGKDLATICSCWPVDSTTGS